MGNLRLEPKQNPVRFVALNPGFAVTGPHPKPAELIIEVDSLRIRLNRGFDTELLRQVLAVVTSS